ncbi:MAG: Maf and M48 domain-containing protein [Candidatus Omnitrophica bacterium]|nr:Maf and M48 domain-containing protein [Candidatus Omnitrophota bacterium]
MRQIYLASDSKARKKLFKILGLRFKVLPSGIREKKSAGKGMSYARLVKTNALLKAKACVKKVKSGIIIAADTIVVQDGRVFGKPKDLKDAHRMLKRLSGRTQLVYTGLAVIDKDRRREKAACEKTRIYMDKLSDREIDNYFSYVSPLDKAGSFDIQGKGAFFIRRIDGCFYNVVGLPVSRLYRLFREMGIRIFAVMVFLLPLCGFILSGCSTEYNVVTGKEEKYYYSTESEVKMGESFSKQVEQQYKLAGDPLLQKRVEDIGQKIAAVCDRRDIRYHFKVIDDEEVNAVSLPGGFVYVNKGLIEKVSNDNELAGVLAHEVGHIVARHSIKKIQGIMGYNVLRILTAQIPSDGSVGNAADIAFTELMLGYSREDELLADRLGARYSKRAGYDPRGMLAFLLKLQEINHRKPPTPRNYLKTHPYVPDRIRVVKEELGQSMNFTDYINTEDKEHE